MQLNRLVFENPETRHLRDHAVKNSKRGHRMARRDELKEKPGAVIVGCGNSVKWPEVMDKIRRAAEQSWYIVGIKEAITFLKDNGIRVDAGCNMDPQAREAERTPAYPDVTYYLATTSHPKLYGHLESHKCPIRMFNNVCGARDRFMAPGFVLDLTDFQKAIVAAETVFYTDANWQFCPVCVSEIDEVSFYQRTFGTGDTMQGGFTVANRAFCLMEYMGVKNIAMAGVDFGWREGSEYYADFIQAKPLDQVFMEDHGNTDMRCPNGHDPLVLKKHPDGQKLECPACGRPFRHHLICDECGADALPGEVWWSRGDLLASAKEVAKLILQGRVEIWGDSIAGSFAARGLEFTEKSCSVG